MSLWQHIHGAAAIHPDSEKPWSAQSVEPAETTLEITEDVARVAAAREGDRSAFGWLYERYFRMVHGILLARVPRDDVRDLVQDVFLQALRKLPALRDPAFFGGWLAQIARNRANDFYRRGGISPQEECLDQTTDERAASPEDKAAAHAALRILRELPEAYREPLILRLVEGMTGPEIAARTGLTAGSVRVNLHRGMRMFRERLAQGTKP